MHIFGKVNPNATIFKWLIVFPVLWQINSHLIYLFIYLLSAIRFHIHAKHGEDNCCADKSVDNIGGHCDIDLRILVPGLISKVTRSESESWQVEYTCRLGPLQADVSEYVRYQLIAYMVQITDV